MEPIAIEHEMQLIREYIHDKAGYLSKRIGCSIEEAKNMIHKSVTNNLINKLIASHD